jgi:large subunit ribosomal protein L9
MKVVLLENLDKGGKKGEVIVVADGYAINHLIPRKLAKVATPEALKEIEAIRQAEEKQQAELAKEAMKIKE